MTTATIEAFKKASAAENTEPKAKPARAARVTGGAKPAKAKAPAKAQKKSGLPSRAKNDFSDDQVLTLKQAPEGGWLAERYTLLKSGQTVGEALATFTAQTPKLRRRRESLRKLIEAGHISVK